MSAWKFPNRMRCGLITLCLAAVLPTPAKTGGGPEPADRLVNRVWMQEQADRPGVIRTFLSDGTLLMNSCWETFRLERWHRDGNRVVWTEDTAEIRADIVSLTDAELVLDLQLGGGVERRSLVAAKVPYLCPDVPKGTAAAAAAPALTYGCDDPAGEPFTFAVRYIGEAVEMGLPERFGRSGPVTVPQVRAASGAKFESDGMLFWTAGERVRLDIDGVSFGPCAQWPDSKEPLEPAVTEPWQQAQNDGVSFRALGQEPFWKLDVIPGRWMRFELVGAEPLVSTPVPEAETVDGKTVYHAVTEAHDLEVEIEPSVCHDSMSGHEFEATVTVTLNGEAFHGCGRAP